MERIGLKQVVTVRELQMSIKAVEQVLAHKLLPSSINESDVLKNWKKFVKENPSVFSVYKEVMEYIKERRQPSAPQITSWIRTLNAPKGYLSAPEYLREKLGKTRIEERILNKFVTELKNMRGELSYSKLFKEAFGQNTRFYYSREMLDECIKRVFPNLQI